MRIKREVEGVQNVEGLEGEEGVAEGEEAIPDEGRV
jgi:hypothetical protein